MLKMANRTLWNVLVGSLESVGEWLVNSVPDPDPPDPMFLGLPDPDPDSLGRGIDPDHQAKIVRQTLIPTVL
jgi:hypothetical protein